MIPPWIRKAQLDTSRAGRILKSRQPFISWDGEGVVHNGRKDMSYVLFGTSTGDYITGQQLSTVECLNYIDDNGRDGINVAFGFGFDVDQILRDIPTESLKELLKSGSVLWEDWKIEWIPGKLFTIRRRGKGNKPITIADTLSFFRTTLIGACKEYLPGHPLIEAVEKGKANRDSFQFDELPEIIKYWEMEQSLFIDLMEELRSAFIGAGLALTSWHGPGAVASALFRREKIASHIVESRIMMPQKVTDATAYAYFGGRFEQPQMGYIEGPIYGYDIRSAYVAALAWLHSSLGEWTHEYDPTIIDDHSLYHTNWFCDGGPDNVLALGPLPIRLASGVVSYGLSGEGWHYGCEINAARSAGFQISVSEGWTVNGGSKRPFAFLEEIYLQRRDWKRAGNPAQFAAKLSMNSVYGKLAQLVGWDEKTGEPPKYHHQWYAGQITAWCRSVIMRAVMQNPEAIISIETDGIYSTAPLKLRFGDHLGEWEASEYDNGLFVQSGVYYLQHGGEWKTAKVRGLSTGKVPFESAFEQLSDLSSIRASVRRYGSLTGFIDREHWHEWHDQDREISWGGGGKRAHFPPFCDGCLTGGQAHRTVMTVPHAGQSHPRKLPWITSDGLDWTVIDSTE